MKTPRGRRGDRVVFSRTLAEGAHASETLYRNPAIPDNPALTRLFSLREIAEKTGLPPRGMQFWVEHGVLRCDAPDARTGRGVHRHFHPVEVQTASLLVPLATGELPVNVLHKFSAVFRACLVSEPLAAVDMPAGLVVNDWRATSQTMFRAAHGEGLNFLVVPYYPARPSAISTVTDEAGPPILDLADYNMDAGFTMIVNMTARLAHLFT